MNKIKIFIILFFTLILSFFFFQYYSQTQQRFEIVFINVGQGNATIIKTKNRKQIIVDSGNEMIALQNISRNLGFFNRYFDISFITHYDIDHAGLFPYFIKNFKTGIFFESEATPESPIRNNILKNLKLKNIQIESLFNGKIIYLDKDTKIEVLFPDNLIKRGELDSNESSLVLKIYHKKYTFLITGDLPSKFEKYLVKKYGKKLKSDVLLAGHHGSQTSSSENFLKIVNPKYFVISAGRDNKYNFPNIEVVERVKKLNINILRTDKLGNITFFIENNDLIYRIEKD